jgi:hypothetical protein
LVIYQKGVYTQVLPSLISLSSETENTSGNHKRFNPLNTKLNPICHLLALLEAHHILHISRVRVKRIFKQFLIAHSFCTLEECYSRWYMW